MDVLDYMKLRRIDSYFKDVRRECRVPLQTIRAKIDYCSYGVRTIYGVLGIKIWIFGE
ncbi:hypothetical protein BT93_H1894 [Corymbia citriodora subsp. variegata]|nr:hypothetical protein BT93_H1894 [Corymbia citriodora subsp. variegata]